MRISGESASQISDDECQGGICPSCRLAINKDTGRLKWCMGGNNVWRTRIRLMLLIPAVILPVTIVIIALSKSTVIGKLSMRSPHAVEDDGDAVASDVLREQQDYYKPIVQNTMEQSEVANKLLHPDVETSFIPSESLIVSQNLQRHKRDMDQAEARRSGASGTSSKSRRSVADGEPLESEPLQELQVKLLKL